MQKPKSEFQSLVAGGQDLVTRGWCGLILAVGLTAIVLTLWHRIPRDEPIKLLVTGLVLGTIYLGSLGTMFGGYLFVALGRYGRGRAEMETKKPQPDPALSELRG